MVECNHVWDETSDMKEELISAEKYGNVVRRGWVNKCVKCGAEELRTVHTIGRLSASASAFSFPSVRNSEESFYDRHFGDIMACIIGGYLLILLGLLLMVVFK